MTATIIVADTAAARAAHAAFLARTAEPECCSYCSTVLEDDGRCSRCEDESAAEIAAEEGYVRMLESTYYPCYCGRGQGGICC